MKKLVLLVVLACTVMFSPKKAFAEDIYVGDTTDGYRLFMITESIEADGSGFGITMRYLAGDNPVGTKRWLFSKIGRNSDEWYYHTNDMGRSAAPVAGNSVLEYIVEYCLDYLSE